ncbi:MAG: hypothetical protein KatS3mg087_0115 [Patescibacteria group bacterium]|nr:MAG: hypothetical protein KatS3mg087_0115 [Patescibacteria group bacterium]
MAKQKIKVYKWKLIQSCPQSGCQDYNCPPPDFSGEVVGEREVTACGSTAEPPSFVPCEGCFCVWSKVTDDRGVVVWGNPTGCQPTGSGQVCNNCICTPPTVDPQDVVEDTVPSPCMGTCARCACRWVWRISLAYPFEQWVLDPICRPAGTIDTCYGCVCSADNPPPRKGRYDGEVVNVPCKIPDDQLPPCAECSCIRQYNVVTGRWEIKEDCQKTLGQSSCTDCHCPELYATPSGPGEAVKLRCVTTTPCPDPCEGCVSYWTSSNSFGDWRWIMQQGCSKTGDGTPCLDCIAYPPNLDAILYPGETKPGICVPSCEGCFCSFDSLGYVLQNCSQANYEKCCRCECQNEPNTVGRPYQTPCYPVLPPDYNKPRCDVCTCSWKFTNGRWEALPCKDIDGRECVECSCPRDLIEGRLGTEGEEVFTSCRGDCYACSCQWVWNGFSWLVVSDCQQCRGCHCESVPVGGGEIGEVYQSNCIYGTTTAPPDCTSCTCYLFWDQTVEMYIPSGCKYGDIPCEDCSCPVPDKFTGQYVIATQCQTKNCSSCYCTYIYMLGEWWLMENCRRETIVGGQTTYCSDCMCGSVGDLGIPPEEGMIIEVPCTTQTRNPCQGCTCERIYDSNEGVWMLQSPCQTAEGHTCSSVECFCPYPQESGSNGEIVTLTCVPSQGFTCQNCRCEWKWNPQVHDWQLTKPCHADLNRRCPDYCTCNPPAEAPDDPAQEVVLYTDCGATPTGCNCKGKYVNGVWTVIEDCNRVGVPEYCRTRVCLDPQVANPDPDMIYDGVCEHNRVGCELCSCFWECMETEPGVFEWIRTSVCRDVNGDSCADDCTCLVPAEPCYSQAHSGLTVKTDCQRTPTQPQCKCKQRWDAAKSKWVMIEPCDHLNDDPNCRRLSCPEPAWNGQTDGETVLISCSGDQTDCDNCACIYIWSPTEEDWVLDEECYKEPERKLRCEEQKTVGQGCVCYKPPKPTGTTPEPYSSIKVPCNKPPQGCCCN